MTWRSEFAGPLESLLASSVVRGRKLPDLSAGRLRDLVRQNRRDKAWEGRIARGTVEFNADTSAAIQSLCDHPVLCEIATDDSDSRGIQITVLGSGVSLSRRKALLHILAQIVLHAIVFGITRSIERFDDVLNLGKENRLPGFEATFVVGIRLDTQWSIADGLRAVPYDQFRAKLIPPSAASSYDEMLRPHSTGSAPLFVLIRESRWGPAVSRAGTLSDPGELRLRFQSEHDALSFTDSLALAVGRPLMVIAQSQRADRWVHDILGPNLGVGIYGESPGPKHADIYEDAKLTTEQRENFRRLFTYRRPSKRKPSRHVDLAVSRLISALGRRGMLAEEDSVLDIAIAMEALYQPGMGEITEKLSSRAAWLLGSGVDERKRIRKSIKEFYKLRSKIAHGSKLGASDDIQRTVFDVACRTLECYAIAGAVPSNWDGIVMGEVTAAAPE